MERELLLLGLLRGQEMYGYQLNAVIDSHVGASVELTKPTAYRLLGKMEKDGWLTCRDEREGNRPARRVYALTPAGEAAFMRLLRASLASYRPVAFASDISLAFLDTLSPAEVLPLLGERRAAIEQQLQAVLAYPEHPGGLGLMVEHQKRHLANELAWIDEVIARVQASSRNG